MYAIGSNTIPNIDVGTASQARASPFHSVFDPIAPTADASIVKLIRAALYQVKRKGASVGLLGLSTRNPLLPRLRKEINEIK